MAKRPVKIQFGHLEIGQKFTDSSKNPMYLKTGSEKALNLLNGSKMIIADKMRVHLICSKGHAMEFLEKNSEIKYGKIFECSECDFRVGVFETNIKY